MCLVVGAYLRQVLFLGDSITDKRHVGCQTNYWGFLQKRYGFKAHVYGINGHQMSAIALEVGDWLKPGMPGD